MMFSTCLRGSQKIRGNSIISFRFLAVLDPQDAMPIWEEYRTFCSDLMGEGGDVEMLEKVEGRIRGKSCEPYLCVIDSDAYPGNLAVRGLLGISHRYNCFGTLLYDSAKADQGFLKRNRKAMLQTTSGDEAIRVSTSSSTQILRMGRG